jgi:mycoredoxin
MKAMNKKLIKVYGTTTCADCYRAKNWLTSHNIPFEDIDISQDEAAIEYVLKLTNGMQSVPTILFPDNSVLIEPSNAELEQKIQSLGLFPTQ